MHTPIGSLFILIACIPLFMWFTSAVPIESKLLLPLTLVSGIIATVATVQGNVSIGTIAGGIATFSGMAESHLRHKRDKASEATKKPKKDLPS